MKKSKFIVAGGLLLSLAAFQSCNNEAAVNEAKAAAAARVTAVTDSLQGAWKADVDAVNANCATQTQMLTDSLASVSAKLQAATAKKAPAAKKPAAPAPKPAPGPQKPKVTSR